MDTFFPYLAGYVDGDGHFRFRKFIQKGISYFHCKLMITSTNEHVLKFFAIQIGGTYYKKANPNPKWKQEYIYTLHIGKNKFQEIRKIGDYLLEKKSQFDLIDPFINGTKQERQEIVQKAAKERDSFKAKESEFERIKSLSRSVHVCETDFIYLAGYIDAEGSITITKKTLKTGSVSYSCHIRVNVTRFPCIEFVFSRFGGHLSIKNSSVFEWGITDKSTEEILPKILPYLIVKKRQCEIAISLRLTFKDRVAPRDKHFLSYYQRETPIRESLFLSLKSLNRRGI